MLGVRNKDMKKIMISVKLCIGLIFKKKVTSKTNKQKKKV